MAMYVRHKVGYLIEWTFLPSMDPCNTVHTVGQVVSYVYSKVVSLTGEVDIAILISRRT